ncbi:transporter [Luteolibacter ambystomatis]|uniref:Transporter n=1 Tax=Luteolibacter ambystomatis TaxID=2824561 RepID=A0A975GA07_9BACT|nr:transporter [Luteolibacter ambystomatis]QUE51175.1 transporter [Luteolibacter ambystomatis]
MKPSIRIGIVTLAGMGTLRAAYPLVVDDAAIHPPGEREIDVTVDVRRDPATHAAGNSFSFTTGICSRIEGSVGLGFGWQRERDSATPNEREGLLDLSLGLKTPLVDSSRCPFALSLSSTATLPTASHGLGVGATNFNFLLIATREWGRVSFDGNAGFNWVPESGRDNKSEEAGFFGAALRWQTTEKWMLFVETYMLLPDHDGADLQSFLRCGCQAEVTRGVYIGGAFEAGCKGTEEAAISLGLTLIF